MAKAGKSTLISKLTRIAVKIAPYPFTTLRPNLGILPRNDGTKILIADIPGLIDKASQNKGLGCSFLRHIERTSTLLLVIELAPHQERDPFADFLTLRHELEAYNPALLDKPFLTILNKIDQEDALPLAQSFRSRYPFPPETLFTISAREGTGLDLLEQTLLQTC